MDRTWPAPNRAGLFRGLENEPRNTPPLRTEKIRLPSSAPRTVHDVKQKARACEGKDRRPAGCCRPLHCSVERYLAYLGAASLWAMPIACPIQQARRRCVSYGGRPRGLPPDTDTKHQSCGIAGRYEASASVGRSPQKPRRIWLLRARQQGFLTELL